MEYSLYYIRKDGSECKDLSNLREHEVMFYVERAMRKVWENPDILIGITVKHD